MVIVNPGVCLFQGLVIEGCRLDWLRRGASTPMEKQHLVPSITAKSGHRELRSCLTGGDRSTPIEQGCIFGNWSGTSPCPGSRMVQTWCRSSDRRRRAEILKERIITESLGAKGALSWEPPPPPPSPEVCRGVTSWCRGTGARVCAASHRDPRWDRAPPAPVALAPVPGAPSP